MTVEASNRLLKGGLYRGGNTLKHIASQLRTSLDHPSEASPHVQIPASKLQRLVMEAETTSQAMFDALDAADKREGILR